MPRNFSDRLLDEIDAKQNPSCGGLDPVVRDLPPSLVRQVIIDYNLYDYGPDERAGKALEATGEAFFRFNKALIDKTSDIFPVFKPQIAFYEKYKQEGIRAFARTVDYCRDKGVLVIADVKREDIGKTAGAYADAHIGNIELIDGSYMPGFNEDALTVGPYIGSDSVGEFAKVALELGKGVFVLDKTSNPSSGDVQDLKLAPVHGGRKVYEHMALLIDQWGSKLKGLRGYSSLGAVVGATYPEIATRCREMMENAIILVPAYGTQGGTAKDAMPNFNEDGYGAVVSNSSSFSFAYQKEPYRSKYGEENFADASREAALVMREDLTKVMKATGRIPSGW